MVDEPLGTLHQALLKAINIGALQLNLYKMKLLSLNHYCLSHLSADKLSTIEGGGKIIT
jgi:hypothetical protein